MKMTFFYMLSCYSDVYIDGKIGREKVREREEDVENPRSMECKVKCLSFHP